MAYRVIISLRAQKEIEDAIDYYKLHSTDAPLDFIVSIREAYGILERNPFLRVRYKAVRAINLARFPYLLYFVINEKHNTVRVLSCFHNKRNPDRRP